MMSGANSDVHNSQETGISQANTSVQHAAQMAQASTMPHPRMGASEKEKKLQNVQYECIKSELKEEYEKRVGFLNKRLTKKAQMDPSFLLLNSMTQSAAPLTTQSASVRSGSQSFF